MKYYIFGIFSSQFLVEWRIVSQRIPWKATFVYSGHLYKLTQIQPQGHILPILDKQKYLSNCPDPPVCVSALLTNLGGALVGEVEAGPPEHKVEPLP